MNQYWAPALPIDNVDKSDSKSQSNNSKRKGGFNFFYNLLLVNQWLSDLEWNMWT